jgi:hypothetical protein
MRQHDLRASAGPDRGVALVHKLFLSLGRGRWDRAAAWVEDPVDVFGASVSRARFAENTDGSLGGVLARLDELPQGDVAEEVLSELLGLPVDVDDRVFFATTEVNGEPASYGVLVSETDRDPRVRAIFDPSAFKAWALAES